MADTGYPSPTMVTISGFPTEFLPMPTAWPTGTGCDNNIYQQADGHFLAWDPFYGMSISASARTCLPPYATSWWAQSSLAATPTSLGPTFACPAAYTTATTSVVKSTTTIFCCPSNYNLATAMTEIPSFPSQCASMPQEGETLEWMKIFQSSNALVTSKTTSVVKTADFTVMAIPVNGLEWATTTSTATTSPSETGTSSRTSTGSNSNTATADASSGSSGTPLGVSVGVSVGVVLGVLACALVGFLLWRRRKRANKGSPIPPPSQADEGFNPEYKYAAYPPQTPYSESASPYTASGAPHYQTYQQQPQQYHEAPSNQRDVYEMPENTAARELDSASSPRL